jgi:transposase InsO family protein
MLRREGWRANHKRVERLYREEGLSLRRRRRCKRLSHLRIARERPVAANQTWAVDFIHGSLINGRHFRAFAVPFATASDPEPYSFSVTLRPSEGGPEKLRYEYGTDRRSKNEPISRRLLTYEWDAKRGKTITLQLQGANRHGLALDTAETIPLLISAVPLGRN